MREKGVERQSVRQIAHLQAYHRIFYFAPKKAVKCVLCFGIFLLDRG